MRLLSIVASTSASPPVLRRLASNATTQIGDQKLTIAPNSSATIQVASHPRLSSDTCCVVYTKSSRIFVRVDSGQGDGDELGLSLLTADSGVYLEGSQMRMGVDYMVSPNSTLCFGEEGNDCFVVEFDEEGSNGPDAMSKMLVQGMMAGASKDVRDALQDKL